MPIWGRAYRIQAGEYYADLNRLPQPGNSFHDLVYTDRGKTQAEGSQVGMGREKWGARHKGNPFLYCPFCKFRGRCALSVGTCQTGPKEHAPLRLVK